MKIYKPIFNFINYLKPSYSLQILIETTVSLYTSAFQHSNTNTDSKFTRLDPKTENELLYVLTKLSDETVTRLLNYRFRINNPQSSIEPGHNGHNYKMNKFHSVAEYENSGNNIPQQGFFKLRYQEVNPPKLSNPYETNKLQYAYENTINKLKSLLKSRSIDNQKRELLFDVLVAQLRTLCCSKERTTFPTVDVDNNEEPVFRADKEENNSEKDLKKEYLFLLGNAKNVNDLEKDEIISVDPNIVNSKNSTVLILGSLNKTIPDTNLKIVIDRLTSQLVKPEYVSMLNKISENKPPKEINQTLTLNQETRRYIKPHRCNYQSKLAKVFGGPRWLICTGYMNLNTPSLYD